MLAAIRRGTANSLQGSIRRISSRSIILVDSAAQKVGPCPQSLARRTSVAVGSLQRNDQARRCFSQKDKGGAEHHEEFLKQMQELQAERDTLFGFTDDDRNGWSQSKGHQFDPSFLNEVNQARDDHFSNDASPSKSVLADYTSEADPAETVQVQSSPAIENNNSNTAGFAGLSHLSTDGTSIHMVHVDEKKVTSRVALAQAKVILPDAVMKALVHDTKNSDLVGPKGPIFATAKVAGIMAAKKTSELIPLCHPLPLDSVNIDISLDGRTVTIQCECRVTHKTGVEMEALTGATMAALTIYDMVKAMSHDIEISQTRLLSKSGGKRTFLHTDVGEEMR